MHENNLFQNREQRLIVARLRNQVVNYGWEINFAYGETAGAVYVHLLVYEAEFVVLVAAFVVKETYVFGVNELYDYENVLFYFGDNVVFEDRFRV